ncbi:MAG: spore protease YyaC [Clostridiales bacterium]|nr:spore protease YyaC [Clostridiales bacterium]
MQLETQKVYYHRSGTAFSPAVFASQLMQLTEQYFISNPDMPIFFLCIGSDRVLGDTLGPVIGYKLEKILSYPFRVFGTLSTPVHALNLCPTLVRLSALHHSPLTIAIDASVGRKESVGCITLSNRSIRPGTGVSKTLPKIGQISITGIVSEECFDISSRLQNIRLGLIMELADSICSGIQTFQEMLRF